MRKAPLFLIGGGVAAIAALFFAKRKSATTTDAITRAVSGTASSSEGDVVVKTPSGASGAKVAVHTTGYWPYQEGLTAAERKMEGGVTDRRGNKLFTLEQHLSDPVTFPYVSVAGDYTIWPYAQRISLSAWPNAIFRVVDTGGHFFGAKKVYRVSGEEPLDIAVNSSKTVVPKSGVIATIFTGDNFEKGKAVATGKFTGQTVTAGNEIGPVFGGMLEEDDLKWIGRTYNE